MSPELRLGIFPVNIFLKQISHSEIHRNDRDFVSLKKQFFTRLTSKYFDHMILLIKQSYPLNSPGDGISNFIIFGPQKEKEKFHQQTNEIHNGSI